MPSLRHEIVARLIPRFRNVEDLEDEQAERERVTRWHACMDRSLPVDKLPRSARSRLSTGQQPGFPVHRIAAPVHSTRSLVYLHGGGYTAPLTGPHLQYAARLAGRLEADLVLPDYPLAPEHTWKDSHDALVDLTAAITETGPTVLAGDSAGGGLALAVAQSLRDRGATPPTALLLHSPWVDLTTSSRATSWFAARDPWLRLGKLEAYARWWAGSEEERGRPEVSPALGDLAGLPRTLMFCGTRDLLVPGCRLLAARGRDAGWDLTYVEEPGLIHVYPLLPFIPEARRAWRTTLDFLG